MKGKKKKRFKIIIGLIILIITFWGIKNVTDKGNSKEYDVVVIGTDPEGVVAAVSSARNGLNTLLIDKRSKVGGLMTVGGLNSLDMNYSPNKEILNQGIFMEFYNQINPKNKNYTSFNIEKAEKIFNNMISAEKNITKKLNVKVINTILEGNKIIGIKVLENGKEKMYFAKRFIDATQDGDIAAMSGVPYSIGMEDTGVKNEKQVVTMVFEVAGVNWNKIVKTLENDNDPSTGADDVSAWGFLDKMKIYKAVDAQIRMRGLNIGRQDKNTVLINAMHIFGVDALDPVSVKDGEERAKKELPYIIKHLQENVPGFEKCYLKRTMDELYIRESRHIYGEYRLTINDILENTNFEDKIAFGSYPVDVQPTNIKNWGFVIGAPKQYSIPFRCLVPQKIDNLLVVGRSASYDSLAHGTARVIPVGMQVAEAAGVASYYSIKNNIMFRDITKSKTFISDIQQILKKQGDSLDDFYYSYENKDRWGLPAIRFMLSKGLINSGYNNDYKLDETMDSKQFENLFNNLMKRSLALKDKESKSIQVSNKSEMTKDDVANVLCQYVKEGTYKNAFEYAVKKQYISVNTAKKVNSSSKLTKEQIYMILMDFVKATVS